MSEDTITVDVCGVHWSPAADWAFSTGLRPWVCYDTEFLQEETPCGDWRKVTLRREWQCAVAEYVACFCIPGDDAGDAGHTLQCRYVWIGEADE